MISIRRAALPHLAKLAARVQVDADRIVPTERVEWSAAAREFLASQRPRPDVPGPMPHSPDGGNWEGGCTDTQGRRWVHVPNEGWRIS